ncbi:MAG: SUMF1/EgtB/PvdO family nonheme iron enzyme [Anaerolineales bacterium]|nr:SUMF1/EgtB/PvdO family nonheme iron enzyme [Anaerolineales bacterium]
MPLAQGQVLNNRYRVVNLLGQGGFGAVYRAWDITFEIPCAIKENTEITEAAQRQFLREARMLRTLRHPNLPMVSDYFVVAGQGQYLVMDYVEGQDLDEMLRGGPLPEARVLPWIMQVCDALSYLHAQNPPIIHRDVKPGNIKITPQGKAVLVDFGIAKVYDPAMATTIGARAVTPGFSPVEQYGKGKTDPRSDIYSLGATLYTLLTGVTLPDSVDIMSGAEPAPLPAQRANPAVSPHVSAAIDKAIQVDHRARWASAEEFKRALSMQPAAAARETRPVDPQGAAASSPARVAPTKVVSHSPARKPRRAPAWARKAVFAFLALVGVTILYQAAKPFSFLPHGSATPDFSDERGVPMMRIPAGEFQMGSEDGYSDERPVHEVSLEAFYIDVYEVTNQLYAECVQAGVCDLPDCDYYGKSEYADHPVVCVDWNQAQAYCEWRGARLPSEAEWEKAARGGLQGARYPWGDEGPTCLAFASNGANFDGCSFLGNGSGTMPVGSFRPNGYGLFDMAGNVWEWVLDWYDVYPGGDPGASDYFGQTYRVVRGGSWLDDEYGLRSASRYGDDPTGTDVSFGFRCARSP